MPRQTADVIALILAVVVAVVVILTAIAMLYIQITSPGQDVGYAAETISRLVGIIVAALVGYMAGRKVET